MNDQTQKQELVIFDIDNTLIKGQSQQILLTYLFQKGLLGFFPFLKIYLWFMLYKMGLKKNPLEIMNYAFAFLENWQVEDFEKILKEFVKNKLRGFFFQDGLELIKQHKKAGRKLLLVSNTIDVLVKEIADFLGVKDYIGTRLSIQNNKFTGKVANEIVYGENKVDYVKKYIAGENIFLANSWAYGDHITDLPILELAARPFVVNPKSELRQKAMDKKWPVLFFKKTLNQ